MSDGKSYNKPVRAVVPLGNKATMKISNEVVEQIRYLHEQVGSIEWSGLLMMRIKGSLADIDNLVVEVEGIIPCDIGTSASTSYSMSDHMEDVEELFPEWDLFADNRWNGKDCTEGTKIGQIHTHHSLGGGAYFSVVDDGDLDENAGNHGLYVSLIVAMNGSYVAKGAFVANTEVKTTMAASDFPTNLEIIQNEERLVTFKFDLEYETNGWLIDKVDSLYMLKLEAEEAAAATKMVGTIQNWTKHLKDGAKNFKPMPYHDKQLADAGFDHVHVGGFGNFYRDSMGNCYNDGGELVTEEQLLLMGIFFDEQK